ncbi:MAG: GDSL-type esterase/lipase family protein [Elusimicrobiota bacterium]|jgi:lysophospholipase L1-like esterase|nr:GDSL-type esterase/lipase family protein [Elusimicrobiota bacterium]
MKIICLGDSLTYGFGISRSGIWTNIASIASGFELVNKGINGDTTGGMLARFDRDVLRENPSVVLAIGGANDIFTAQSDANARSNMFAMFNLAASKGLLFITASLIPLNLKNIRPDWAAFTDMPKVQDLCEKYNAWLKLFAKTFGAGFIDLESAFKNALQSQNLYLEDGLHPNKEGHKALGAYISEKLSMMLKK